VTRPARENLTGVWHGLYSYPEGLGAAAFVATLIEAGARFSGSIHEDSNNDGEPVRRLNATVDGRRAGQMVTFAKAYDGASGWDHTVYYEGVLSEDLAEIEGLWFIPRIMAGRFMMIRSQGLPDAARREAFERV
jgi:hypothetical protein